jgi:hypothetical protein
VIAIDGSDGGFLHTLGEVEPDAVTIGMKVEAVWRPMGERTGSILDIAYFRPRQGDPGGSGGERGRASGGPRGEDDG